MSALAIFLPETPAPPKPGRPTEADLAARVVRDLVTAELVKAGVPIADLARRHRASARTIKRWAANGRKLRGVG